MIHDDDLLEKMCYILSRIYESKQPYYLQKKLREIKANMLGINIDSMMELDFEIDEELRNDDQR